MLGVRVAGLLGLSAEDGPAARREVTATRIGGRGEGSAASASWGAWRLVLC